MTYHVHVRLPMKEIKFVLKLHNIHEIPGPQIDSACVIIGAEMDERKTRRNHGSTHFRERAAYKLLGNFIYHSSPVLVRDRLFEFHQSSYLVFEIRINRIILKTHTYFSATTYIFSTQEQKVMSTCVLVNVSMTFVAELT